MNCPMCNGDTMVTDSRIKEKIIHRRRKCLSCDFRFGTDEIASEEYKQLKNATAVTTEKAFAQLESAIHSIERIIKNGTEN